MSTTFAQLGVPTFICQALERRGITEAFEIQEVTVRDGLAGRDILGRAPTGSGKTIAFGIPVIARAQRARAKKPTSLILSPTRELAEQINKELKTFAGRVRIGVVYGGVSYRPQLRTLSAGVDVLVACPGRLEDLINQKVVSLEAVSHVVLDEADRMADMGFTPAVRRLLDQTAKDRQTVLFSATLDGDVAKLTRDYQTNPARHEVGEETPDITAASHVFWKVAQTERVALATSAIQAVRPAIVFCRTRHGSDRLTKKLVGNGVAAVAIHGGRSQRQRSDALRHFKEGRVHALVATDVAARGIHVNGVAAVIHFDPPEDHKAYVHRSGRTARAGEGGVVVSLVQRGQMRSTRRLQQEVGLSEPFVDPDIDVLRKLFPDVAEFVAAPVPPPEEERPRKERPIKKLRRRDEGRERGPSTGNHERRSRKPRDKRAEQHSGAESPNVAQSAQEPRKANPVSEASRSEETRGASNPAASRYSVEPRSESHVSDDRRPTDRQGNTLSDAHRASHNADRARNSDDREGNTRPDPYARSARNSDDTRSNDRGSYRGPSRNSNERGSYRSNDRNSARGPSQGSRGPSREGGYRGPTRNTRPDDRGGYRGPSRNAYDDRGPSREGGYRGPSRNSDDRGSYRGREGGPSRNSDRGPSRNTRSDDRGGYRGPSREGGLRGPSRNTRSDDRGGYRGPSRSTRSDDRGGYRGPSRDTRSDDRGGRGPSRNTRSDDRGGRGPSRNTRPDDRGGYRGPSRNTRSDDRGGYRGNTRSDDRGGPRGGRSDNRGGRGPSREGGYRGPSRDRNDSGYRGSSSRDERSNDRNSRPSFKSGPRFGQSSGSKSRPKGHTATKATWTKSKTKGRVKPERGANPKGPTRPNRKQRRAHLQTKN